MTKLTSRAIAERTGKHITTVEKAAKTKRAQYHYIKGRGRGGRKMVIVLETMPKHFQDLYNGILHEPEDIMSHTQKRRDAVEYKAYIVEEYWRSGLSPNEYVAQYNRTNPQAPLKTDRLFDWQRKYKAAGRAVAALVDRRGGHNKGQSAIPPDAWEYFNSLYMQPQQLTIQRCYEFTRQQYPNVPAVDAFERKVKRIPKRATILYRIGTQAYKNTLPHVTRDYTTIDSNDIWFSDEHTLDVFTKNKTGKPTRYYLTLWFDARSRMPLDYSISDRPGNTDTVKESLYGSILYTGCVGKALYVDNGMMYKSKDGLNRDYPQSLVNRLGINVIYAQPYNAQAKTIERFFGTLASRFSRLWKTYTGPDAVRKPEYLQRPVNDPKKYLQIHAPSEEMFLEAFADYIEEYRNTSHTGQGMDGRTPHEVYKRELKVMRRVADTEALRLLFGRTAVRTVQKNGIQIMERFYSNDALASYFGQKVTVIYDPRNIDEMNVFTMDMEAICIATAQAITPFRSTTMEDMREAKRQQKAINRAMRDYRPILELPTHQLIAKMQRDEKLYEETGDVPSVEMFNPMLKESQKLAQVKQQPDTVQVDEKGRQQMQDWMKAYAEGG